MFKTVIKSLKRIGFVIAMTSFVPFYIGSNIICFIARLPPTIIAWICAPFEFICTGDMINFKKMVDFLWDDCSELLDKNLRLLAEYIYSWIEEEEITP